MKSLCIVASLAMAVGLLAPAALADGRKPGSVLVYTVHRSGAQFFTIVSVTNSNLTPVNPIMGGGHTNVHFEYANVVANPSDPFRPYNCAIFDRIEYLTPADTLSVLTDCHNAHALGGQEGYLVVSAEDPGLYQTAWSHNYLMGSSFVINAQGTAYSLNAISFESPVAHGNETDLNGDGRLDFDGNEYEEVPDHLYIDSFVALAGSQLALLNLTGGPDDLNTLYFSVWNDNEYPLSATLTFNCWFDQPLSAVSPLFEESFLASLPNDPQELDINCDGVNDLETGWAIIESLGVETPGGSFVSGDGAILGSITGGPNANIDGGHLLWESRDTQSNGTFFQP